MRRQDDLHRQEVRRTRPFAWAPSWNRFGWVAAMIILSGSVAAQDPVDEDATASSLRSARAAAATEGIVLRYRFNEGEEIRYRVTHVARTETVVQGQSSTARSRSVSTKVWTVQDVDESGKMTFTHHVEDVEMWQQSGDGPEVRFNSNSEEEPPALYQEVAATVGVPLATITISDRGEVLQRESDQRQLQFGLGDITIPLPEGPVQVGDSWTKGNEIQVRLRDGRVKPIRTRIRYTLRRYETGVATIQVRTEVLTPVDDPRIESQLMQELTNGSLRFDVTAGRLLELQIDWDSSVVGFSGANSSMDYQARITEELQRPRRVAEAVDLPTETVQPPTVRASRTEGPALRR